MKSKQRYWTDRYFQLLFDKSKRSTDVYIFLIFIVMSPFVAHPEFSSFWVSNKKVVPYIGLIDSFTGAIFLMIGIFGLIAIAEEKKDFHRLLIFISSVVFATSAITYTIFDVKSQLIIRNIISCFFCIISFVELGGEDD